MRRVPELDSLRALAAAIVLRFHLQPSSFAVGWTGVDLFFVLSGYLITKIILENSGSRGFFLSFYARRGLRIWPIYYLSFLAIVLLNPWLSYPQPLTDWPYYLTYTQNVQYLWHHEPSPFHVAFRHTWTLALEEQFYLIWPALVIVMGRKRLIPLCVGVILCAYLSRAGGYFTRSPYSLYILPARCDGFALGGLLAALLFGIPRGSESFRRIRLGVGLTALLATTYFVWGLRQYGMVGCFGLPTPPDPAPTLLMINLFYFGIVGLTICLCGHTLLAPLRFPPLAYLGQISYGIYIYHNMVYWAWDGFPKDFNNNQPWTVWVLKVATTVTLAVISWHLIEKPILGLKDRFRYRKEAPATEPVDAT
jgi:peptidoglycan/LPS O-acetylase OafA/YrhL